jgi:hypothetical protein
MKITERNTCRISGGELIEVFNLGSLPSACSFPKITDPDIEKTPLKLCLNKESGLVQLKHSIDPNELYKEYWYMSGINQSMTMALKNIVDETIKRVTLKQYDVVVDIASNDWTLLKNYNNVCRVGIDPSNIKPSYILGSNDYHINEYFSAKVYKDIFGEKKAKIITSICVLYDLEDPIQFVVDVKSILDEDGIYVAEMSYLPTMLTRNSFETIVGEHLEYYSLQAMEYILDRAGLKVEDVEINDINGGSFRLYIRHAGQEKVTQAVLDMRENEKILNLCDPKTYIDFGNRVEQNKSEMIEFLTTQKKLGKLVVGLAASTKGNTALAYYDIDSELMPYIADRNPMKYGRQTVTRIPIISEEDARAMNPDFFLCLAYHFIDEMLIREKDFIDRGGKFIIPIPKLTILP